MRRRDTRFSEDGPFVDPGEEETVNLAQKIAVSREMTNLLERRLKEMQEIGSVRQKGLALDQDPVSAKCYGELEAERIRIASEALAAELRPVRLAQAKARLDSTTGTAAQRHPSSAAGGDAFDADGSHDLKVGRRGSALASTAVASDARRMKRVQDLKRELQKIEAAYAGRLIDSVVYSPEGEPPIKLDMLAILKFLSYRMNVPYDPKYFRFYLLHPLSLSIAKDLFWFIHCHTFQSSSGFIQEILVSSVADKYVLLSNKVEKNRVLFFQSYPYAIANGVCWAFHYFVPGSRNLYDSNFKLKVYILVVRLLTGMEVSAIAVQSCLERLFPEERAAAEEAGKKSAHKGKGKGKRGQREGGGGGEDSEGEEEEGEDGSGSDEAEDEVDEMSTKALAGPLNSRDKALLGALDSQHVEMLRSLPHDLLVPSTAIEASTLTASRLVLPDNKGKALSRSQSAPESAFTQGSPTGFADGKPAAVEAASATTSSIAAAREPGVLKPTWAKQETAADVGFRSLLQRSKRHQLRIDFCASSISPLVQRFLDVETPTIGRPITLKRTTPVPWSAVGGVDTFHSTVSRESRHAEIRAELQAARNAYADQVSQTRKEDLRVSSELRGRRNAVLHGSQAARAKFCLAITDQLEDRRANRHKNKSGIRPARAPSSLLPPPSSLTAIRADTSGVDNFRIGRAEEPAWENFKASGLGWNPTSAAVEFKLIPPHTTIVASATPQSPKSEMSML